MLDDLENMLGPSPEQLRQALIEINTNVATLIQVLIEKGLVTHDEYAKIRVKISAVVDQAQAAADEKAKADMEKKYPGAHSAASFLNDLLSPKEKPGCGDGSDELGAKDGGAKGSPAGETGHPQSGK